MYLRYDTDIPRSLRFVLNQCYLGDWFVLLQLSKNVNHYFFREFVRELRNDLKEFPKGLKTMEREESAFKPKLAVNLLDKHEDDHHKEEPQREEEHHHSTGHRLDTELLNMATSNPKIRMMQMAAKTGRPMKKRKKIK
jgi:hypothetical protein